MWFLPLLILALAVALSVPLGVYMARMLDPREAPSDGSPPPRAGGETPPDPRLARNGVESLLDSGPMEWKGYCLSLLTFNVLAFVIGFFILAFQASLPLNPDNKGPLAPTTIFNTCASFLCNTNLQHYAGEQHLSYFSQLFFICWKQFITPAIGLAALLAIIRGLRGDPHLGNFYLDLWRGVVYVLLPLSFVVAVLLVAGGMPMTLDGAARVTTLEGGEQTVSRGPVAAVVAIKQLGTNGGGFFGANSTHPYENPNAWTNILECVCIILIPMACVVMFGVMLKAHRHAVIVYGVMLAFLITFIAFGIVTDTMAPNPGLAGLPLDQKTGNLEGKELRFGPSAGMTWAAFTTCTSNGSVNCMHDSLNPLAQLVPLSGMWLNCIFGGIGVGLINFLVYLIVAVFFAGLMVGRTPEYLGKKVEAREMKLAMLALLIHPLMVLGPTAVAAISDWGTKAASNPGPHGLTQMLYEFTSASANNGSGMEGLGDTVDTSKEEDPVKAAEKAESNGRAAIWDVLTGLVMIISRFIPIIAPIALAASLSKKKPTPFTAGTLRTDTLTFGAVVLGTIVLVGALLFLPAAALGPVAEHLGPMPGAK